jgi:predicted anti-sigma-YlaC factor YlaD
MVADLCTRIRSQLMFYIDNELKNDKKVELISHLNQCEDCQAYYEVECETKTKICQKLKDSYICQCDVKRLQSSIKNKISEIISIK